MSPMKPLNLIPLTTPRVRHAPLIAPGSLKALYWENNLFAISPGMFTRKVKRTDYLDIFADADRNEFMSPVRMLPIKQASVVTPLKEEARPLTNSEEQSEVAVTVDETPVIETPCIEGNGILFCVL